jgi:dipeptidyl-peptidase 4
MKNPTSLFWRLAVFAGLALSVSSSSGTTGVEPASTVSKPLDGAIATEETIIAQAAISPHWLPGGDAFWYRRELVRGGFEFVFVDALSGTRRKAFDHRPVAQQLQGLTRRITNPEALPFSWINLAPDASWVRFRAHGKAWTLASDGALEEWHGGLSEEMPNLADRDIHSLSSDVKVAITFVNHATGPLALEWIGFDGKPTFLQTIDVGMTGRQQTYAGHVWRLSNTATGVVQALYVAPEKDFVAVIDERTTLQESFEGNLLSEDSNTPKRAEGMAELPRVFVRGFNVWVAYKNNDEQQITTNGTKENPYDQNRIHLSPDMQYVVVWQYTPEQNHTVTLLESSPRDQLQPKLKPIQYLKPGDRVRLDRPRLFSLDRKTEVFTDDSLFRNPYEMRNVGWSNDSSEYRFLFNERGHQHLRILGMNREGRVRTLVEESSKTFIDYSTKMYRRVMNETGEMLWTSERDGWNHLYLYDLDKGVLKNQVTKGEWVVNSIERVEVDSRRVWFRAYGMVPGQDPYYAHLARVNFDGSDLKILTEGNGTHTWKWSLDRRFLTDTWSRVDYPPTSILRDGETGEKISTIEESNYDNLLASGWSPPEIFTAPGRDGKTIMYGIIIRPSKFDPTKKYPIMEDIYAGPQDFFTPKAFSTLTSYREWADKGYVVVKLDGMGTNWRSKAFLDVCYKNLKDAGFADRKAWIRAAAETRPWMDLSRVGIKGGSAGGQNAAAALLFHGDFYKAAAADSGCHDNRMDKIWWNEQWMGYPIDKSYEDSSNVVHADKLQGALMLIVGDLDDNVDPSSTLQVVNALNVANKDYELLFIPGGRHGCGSSTYGRRRQSDFFRRHLLDS